ncbi:hypothetical protein [Rhodoferax sp.]|uniref:hypothetical protein n=1 Tax=Rhodoferax sp. TaxID=50421 RepID=UPI0028480895|nr:hypothetical protein [Rhodoferax sp.]MDR3368300.1 hypothetical protein [Rhodoferax sp.]
MGSISGVVGVSNAWDNVHTLHRQMQAKKLAKVDADVSGSDDQSELSTTLSDISPKNAGITLNAQEQFTSLDSITSFATADINGDGSLSQTTFDADKPSGTNSTLSSTSR